MSNITVSTHKNNLSISQMLQVVNMGKEKISIPVKNGFSLEHIDGYSSNKQDNEISIVRAIAINNMLELLSKKDAAVLQEAHNDYAEGKIDSNKFMATLTSFRSQLKASNHMQPKASVQGLVVNTIA